MDPTRLARLAQSQTNALVHKRSADELRTLLAARAPSSSASSLQGKLFAAKANFAVQGWPSDACSGMLAGYKSPFTATAVSRLEQAGAVLAGLANMDEFGMGSSGLTSAHGPVINPWNTELSPGGSSSGSAAAVAEGLVDFALGSDTGGSVRLPASHCGVVGFKPTRGTISRFGLIAYANSLDTVGVLSQSVDDAQRVFNAIRGEDGLDMTCRRMQPADDVGLLSTVRIGLCDDFALPEMAPVVREAWRRASEALLLDETEMVHLPVGALPTLRDSLPAYYVIALAEASSNLARYDGVRYGHRTSTPGLELREEYAKSRGEGFGEEVQRRLLMGSLALTRRQTTSGQVDEDTCYYSMASRVRQRLEDDFTGVFAQCDVLLLPTSPWPSSSRSSRQQTGSNVVNAFLEDALTVPASLAGLPAISVPCAVCPASGSPIGMQVVGRRGEDDTVLRVAKLLEARVGFTPLAQVRSGK